MVKALKTIKALRITLYGIMSINMKEGQLENQRLMITNIVITLSVLAFTFGFSSGDALNIINGIGLPAIMIISNLFAIIYIWRTLQYIRVHQARAKNLLSKYAIVISEIDKSKPMPFVMFRLGLAKIQLLMHILLVIAMLIPICSYLNIFS